MKLPYHLPQRGIPSESQGLKGTRDWGPYEVLYQGYVRQWILESEILRERVFLRWLTSHQGLAATIEKNLAAQDLWQNRVTAIPPNQDNLASMQGPQYQLSIRRRAPPRSLFCLARSQIYPIDLILKERSWCPVKLMTVAALINREGMQQRRHTWSKAHKKCLANN